VHRPFASIAAERLCPLAIALAGILLIAGCTSTSSTTPTGPVDARIVLAPGEMAEVPHAAMRIHFQGVLSDSRCPVNALCIQAGDAIARIDVVPTTGALATYDLHAANHQPVRHGDLTIELTELGPHPFAGRPIAPTDYRLTLRITR